MTKQLKIDTCVQCPHSAFLVSGTENHLESFHCTLSQKDLKVGDLDVVEDVTPPEWCELEDAHVIGQFKYAIGKPSGFILTDSLHDTEHGAWLKFFATSCITVEDLLSKIAEHEKAGYGCFRGIQKMSGYIWEKVEHASDGEVQG